MQCDECIKADVCNQKDIYKETVTKLQMFAINVSDINNSYSIVDNQILKSKHGIELKANCNKFKSNKILVAR